MKLSLLSPASGKGKGDPQNREPSGNNCAASTKYHRGKIKQSSKQITKPQNTVPSPLPEKSKWKPSLLSSPGLFCM